VVGWRQPGRSRQSRSRQTWFRLLAALMASEPFVWLTLSDTEGTGKAGRRLTPVARLRTKCRRQVPQVQPDHPALPVRWLYGVLRDLPGAPGLLATMSHNALARIMLDTSIGVSGPRDLTVRASPFVRAKDSRSG